MEKDDLLKRYMRSIERCPALLSMEVSNHNPSFVSLYVKYDDSSLGKIVSDMLDQIPVGSCDTVKDRVDITFTDDDALKVFVDNFSYLQ